MISRKELKRENARLEARVAELTDLITNVAIPAVEKLRRLETVVSENGKN